MGLDAAKWLADVIDDLRSPLIECEIDGAGDDSLGEFESDMVFLSADDDGRK